MLTNRKMKQIGKYYTIDKKEIIYNIYNRYKDSTSDNELDRRLQRNHYKSMGNINEAFREGKRNSSEGFRGGNRSSISVSNVDLSLHSEEIKKFDRLQIPIVGYVFEQLLNYH